MDAEDVVEVEAKDVAAGRDEAYEEEEGAGDRMKVGAAAPPAAAAAPPACWGRWCAIVCGWVFT